MLLSIMHATTDASLNKHWGRNAALDRLRHCTQPPSHSQHTACNSVGTRVAPTGTLSPQSQPVLAQRQEPAPRRLVMVGNWLVHLRLVSYASLLVGPLRALACL